MNEREILALLTAITQLYPGVKDAYNAIAANSNGQVRPLEEIFADTDATITAGEAEADQQIDKQ